MKIILADDLNEVRSGLRILLEQEIIADKIDEAENLEILIAKIKETKYDLVLLDWELDKKEVPGIIPVIKLLNPNTKVIALSSRPEALKSAMEAGADAFVSKIEHPEKLLKAIDNMFETHSC